MNFRSAEVKRGMVKKAFMMTTMMMMVVMRPVVFLIVTVLSTVSPLLNSRMALVKCENGGKKQFCM